MKKVIFIILFIFLLILMGNDQREKLTINVLSFGTEESRISSIRETIKDFNMTSKNIKYELNVEKYIDDLNWKKYHELFEEKFKKNEVDILITGHEYIPILVENEYIYEIDDILRTSELKSEYFKTVWQSINYKSKYWAFPDDIDAQCVYINKNVLRSMGYSNEKIDEIPYRVKVGEFVLEDLIDIAKFGKYNDITQYGLLHRPTAGQYFYMFAEHFGAVSYDENSGYEIDKNKMIEMLNFYYDITQTYNITPNDMIGKSWDDVNLAFVKGETAIYFGSIYSIYDINAELKIDSKSIEKDYVSILFPSIKKRQKPTTISHPMVYVITSNSSYKEDLKQILYKSSINWRKKAINANETYHFPIAKSSISNNEFSKNKFLNENIYMLDYTTFLPNDIEIVNFIDLLSRCISDVEKGILLPEDAFNTYFN